MVRLWLAGGCQRNEEEAEVVVVGDEGRERLLTCSRFRLHSEIKQRTLRCRLQCPDVCVRNNCYRLHCESDNVSTLPVADEYSVSLVEYFDSHILMDYRQVVVI